MEEIDIRNIDIRSKEDIKKALDTIKEIIAENPNELIEMYRHIVSAHVTLFSRWNELIQYSKRTELTDLDYYYAKRAFVEAVYCLQNWRKIYDETFCVC